MRQPIHRYLAYVLAAVVLAAVVFLAIPPPLLQDVSFSRAVFSREGQLLRLTTSRDEKYRLFVPLAQISPELKQAVLLHEDKYFYHHAGINPVSLARAFAQTYLSQGSRLGASTLSMQLARLKFGIYSRSIPGKLWQMFRALHLELHYNKNALFEAYLNLAPYGYNIEGVGAASLVYYAKKADTLTLPEALTLAVIPQSPARRSPQYDQPHKAALIDARNHLFEKWQEVNPASATQAHFFALPLASKALRDLPFEAPHLTSYLLTQDARGSITSTIDVALQRMLSRLLSAYAKDHHPVGINNAAALLLNYQTMEVLALVGSADFFNQQIQGQVDGTSARRSPGSALKPFIYALALEQGLIHPHSLLVDSPATFGAYNPENFDRDFGGPLFAADALRLSRNIPALKLSASLRTPSFLEWLHKAGIKKLKTEKDYGLSLVLGGAEVTMRELAMLYALLANDGLLKPLHYTLPAADKDDASTALLTPEVAFLTLDMLKDTPRPFPRNGGPDIYWKTGTSNGFRDAWTAGVFGPYVLVVWVGNFNGKANPAFVGVRSAAPLFFQMAGAVASSRSVPEVIARKPEKLKISKVSMCAATGDVADKECGSRMQGWFIPGVSPLLQHDVFRKILVDKATGLRACHYDASATEERVMEFWPSDISASLARVGIRKAPPPAMLPGCAPVALVAASVGLRIISPSSIIEYSFSKQAAPDEAVAFKAVSDGDVRTLYWFIDDRFLGSAPPHEDFMWQGTPGRYTVRVVDDKGRSQSVAFNVILSQE